MGFADDANALIEEKNFDGLESLWMNQLERDPAEVEDFLRTAKALRKAEQRTQSDTLLSLLGDTLLERKLWPQRLQVLRLLLVREVPAHLRQREWGPESTCKCPERDLGVGPQIARYR